jgi:hypothetical protein
MAVVQQHNPTIVRNNKTKKSWSMCPGTGTGTGTIDAIVKRAMSTRTSISMIVLLVLVLLVVILTDTTSIPNTTIGDGGMYMTAAEALLRIPSSSAARQDTTSTRTTSASALGTHTAGEEHHPEPAIFIQSTPSTLITKSESVVAPDASTGMSLAISKVHPKQEQQPKSAQQTQQEQQQQSKQGTPLTTTNTTKESATSSGNNSNSKSKASSPDPVATVAHAISFLSCGAALTSKYKDAMLVLRHSIHQNSILAQNSTSRYSYKMYAFVNDDPSKKCKKYTSWIERMGYTPLLLPNPVNISMIENEHFRTQIDKTGVTGSSELIKLYLYTLTDHPIVVHWDIDVIVMVRTGVYVLLVSVVPIPVLCSSVYRGTAESGLLEQTLVMCHPSIHAY